MPLSARGENHLVAEFPLRKPGELEGGCGHSLLAGQVDECLPALVGEVTVDLEAFADSFDYLTIDVVQGGAAGDKVLGGFLIAHTDLEPLVAAQVIFVRRSSQ